MIAEIGHFALILSLAMAVLLSVLPLWGASNNNTMLMNTARPLSWSMFLMLLLKVISNALTYLLISRCSLLTQRMTTAVNICIL